MARTSNGLTMADYLRRHLEHRRVPHYPRIALRPILLRPLIVAKTCNAEIILGGTQPLYDRDDDIIEMPPPNFFRCCVAFKSPRRFAVTALHELIHWTGHRRRLNRPMPREMYDPIYNAEECIAEIGAALLANDLGVARATVLPHAAYVNGYLQTLPNPEIELSAALAAANRAVGFVSSLARSELV